jgi:hypothetical protein
MDEHDATNVGVWRFESSRGGVKKIIAGILLSGLTIVSLSACDGKYTEPYKDAPIDGRDRTPAKIFEMPDGFSNFAFKCNGPVGVYVIFHHDSPYGSISTVNNDPNCTNVPK